MKAQMTPWLVNRWLRRTLWTVASLLALWAIGWLAVPPLLKHQAQKLLGEMLGRQVSIGVIDFKPWTLELTVDDLRIAAASGDTPQVQIQRIYVDAEMESLFRLAPVLDAVRVDGLILRLSHLGDGDYDFDDIVKRQAPSSGRPSGAPTRFAIYNLELRQSSITFDDRPVARVHEVRDVNFSLPFLSNLPSMRQVKVSPRLTFLLNGSAFDSSAEGTPFAQSRKADLTLGLKAMDLAPYLVYLPATLPIKLRSGVLDADLRLSFEQAGAMALALTGSVQATGLKFDDYRSRELLALDAIRINLGSVRPLERDVKISGIELTAPRLVVRRNAAAALDLLPSPVSAPSAAPADPNQPLTKPWKIQLDSIALRSGALSWEDESTQPSAKLALRDVALDVKELKWPFQSATEGGKPAQFSGSVVLPGGALGSKEFGPAKAAGALRFVGAGTDKEVKANVTLVAVDLGLGSAYLRKFLQPELSGRLDAELSIIWNEVSQQVDVARLALSEVGLKRDKIALASVAKLELSGAGIDLQRKAVSVSRLSLDQPKTTVSRGRDGRWMFQDWIKPVGPAATSSLAAAPNQGSSTAGGAEWSLTLADVVVSNGVLGYRDEVPAKPVSADISAFKLQLKNFSPLPAAGAEKPVKASALSLSAQVASGSTEPGHIGYQGSIALQPLSTQGALQWTRLPIHAFEPYFGEFLNIELQRADASFKGQIAYAAVLTPDRPAALRLRVTGDAELEEVRAVSLPTTEAATQIRGSEELLAWKVLSLRGLDLALAPRVAPQVSVAQSVLSDFYARIVIDPQGRINLQHLLKLDAAAAPDSPASAASAASAAATAVAPRPVALAPPGEVVAAADRANISVGPISLVNGRVQFSDRFIRPNYSAALSQLTGRLSAFSSTSPQMADLELRGRAEGTASLEISGKLNPLAQPLALDIKAKVRDLELAPLSPYSVKYAGHGIQRGKLSVDLAYLVKPNGELTASNKLVLNQLTFGDKVDGAPNSLPVRLAVALLADRNGVIDIDLPISGSLNDPQFRLIPIIFRVIGNLILKAVTSPFTLLASALGGGGDELSTVGFEPGASVLGAKATEGLDKVVNALTDRPGLSMTVNGAASLEMERESVPSIKAIEWQARGLYFIVHDPKG